MTDEMRKRGPICECNDPQCTAPLSMTWPEYDAYNAEHGYAPVISDKCEGRAKEKA